MIVVIIVVVMIRRRSNPRVNTVHVLAPLGTVTALDIQIMIISLRLVNTNCIYAHFCLVGIAATPRFDLTLFVRLVS